MSFSPLSVVHSRDSSQSGASDTSSPLTPTFSSRGHTRWPSSSSSLASTPPVYESMGPPTDKLPDVVEDPSEREDEFDLCDDAPVLSPCLCDTISCAHQARSTLNLSSNPEYDIGDDFFSDSETMSQPMAKRRRSGDFSANSLAERLGGRFSSLSRLRGDKKGTSILSLRGSRSATPSRAPSTRASSRGDSIMSPVMQGASLPPTPTKSICEDRNDEIVSLPVEVVMPVVEEPIDRKALASTPLLPPTMTDLISGQEQFIQSPLQSPTIADPNATFSLVNTPVGTPHFPAVTTPPLSSKPSTSSFHMHQSGNLMPSSEIPSLMINKPNDPWAIKLGHANFTIAPEPYLPSTWDEDARGRLLSDWEQARFNFSKHSVRTSEHYGPTSVTFKLTEEKWAEINAQWKANFDVVSHAVVGNSHNLIREGPVEPALIRLPSLNDPKSEGKFPKLGDEDIVGPMVQIASQIQSRPSKRATIRRFFGGLKSSSNALGRSSTAGQLK
ncbi:hypothetical protein LTR04_001561 [Oleoguttula sp. CCFEE 6159]|nr:hypothetical protein LTR04_001561 [Oleoguttula sp. CCFEE 6159]